MLTKIIYASKSNTIASNFYSNKNAGLSTYMYLWYGGPANTYQPYSRNSIARMLLYFDILKIKNFIQEEELPLSTLVNSIIRLKKIYPPSYIINKEHDFDEIEKQIIYDYDIVATPITEYWEQGTGVDIILPIELFKYKNIYNNVGPSNWNYRTKTQQWSESGIITQPETHPFSVRTLSSYKDTYLEIDITNIMLGWLENQIDNEGLCISIYKDYEIISNNKRFIAAFYSSETNTAFKPTLLCNFDVHIQDDRNFFEINKINKHYFIIEKNGIKQNASVYDNNNSFVTITDHQQNVLATNIPIIKQSKGVYYANVELIGNPSSQQLTETWYHFSVNNQYLDENNIYFEKQQFTYNKENIFADITTLDNIAITLGNIVNKDILQSTEIRKIYVNIINKFHKLSITKLNLKIFFTIKINDNNILIKNNSVNRIVENRQTKYYFHIYGCDLMQNQTYFIDITIKYGTYTKTFNNVCEFTVK